MSLTVAELSFIFGADTRQVDAALDGVGRKATTAANTGNRSLGGFWRDQETAAGRFGKVTNGAVSMAKKAFLSLGGIGAGLGVAKFVTDSVKLEAQFGKTMAQMRVATGAPAAQLERMRNLALDLGKDTVFSANEASESMLELAKNGITPAVIQAGALKSALTLAAAGSMDLTEASSTMGNALNAFSLKGTQSKQVAAALAGAANASSANVSDLAYGLSQASASAADAGFSLQETTAVLAAFANKGIQGSDAGTSLKTFLARLIPTTKQAREAMEGYGLAGYQSQQSLAKLHAMGIKPISKSLPDVTNAIRDYLVRTGAATEGTMKLEDKTREMLYQTGMMQSAFVKLNGEFKDMDDIAGILKDRLGDLSDSERAAALNALFGSDARRAATVLMSEGERGIRAYIKATSDQAQAEKMAKANMEGTAGAIERLKGSWETLKLQFGEFIAPAAADGLEWLTETLDGLPDKITPVARSFREDWLPPIKQVAGFAKDLVGFLNDLPKEVKIGGLAGLAALVGGAKLRGGNAGALGTAGKVLGLTKGTPVYVTNWAQIATGGGSAPSGWKPGILATAGKFAGPVGLAAAAAYSIYKMPEIWNFGANKLGEALGLDKKPSKPERGAAGSREHDTILRNWEGAEGAVTDYNKKLERTRDHLLTITNGVTGFASEGERAKDKVLAITNGIVGTGREIDRAKSKAALLRGEFDKIDGRVVTTYFNAVNSKAAAGGIPIDQLVGRHAGGPTNAGQWYIVGEKGPELFQAGVQGRVYSNRDSAAMLGSATAAQSGAAPVIDYDRLTRALLQARPIHGDVHISGDPTVYRREMDRDAHAAAYSGMPT